LYKEVLKRIFWKVVGTVTEEQRQHFWVDLFNGAIYSSHKSVRYCPRYKIGIVVATMREFEIINYPIVKLK